MIKPHANHVDRTRREVSCDEPGCVRRQLMPAKEAEWLSFLERAGWRMSAAGTDRCPFCVGSQLLSDLCTCTSAARTGGPMMFEVRRASATDTRFMCAHCQRWTGSHDADPPRGLAMKGG